MYGVDANGSRALVHFDANLVPLAQIAGSNTQLDVVGELATDSDGNVYTFWDGTVNVYPASASGNVAPVSSIVLNPPPGGSFKGASGFALDGAGGAFVRFFRGTDGIQCAIAHVTLTGPTTNATTAADCSEFGTNRPHAVHTFGIDGRGYLYAGFRSGDLGTSNIIRYTIGTGGTLKRDAALVVISNIYGDPALFRVDTHGNVYSATTFNGHDATISVPDGKIITAYPASSFVSGKTTYGPDVASETFPGDVPLAIDASGNLFAHVSSGSGAIVVPNGSHTVSATSDFSPFRITATARR